MKWVTSFCVVLVLSPFLFGQSSKNRILQTIDDRQMTPVAGSMHPYARADYDQGLADQSMTIHGAALVFKPSAAQQTALDALLKQQQDHSSPNYHKWLTPEEFADRFGMTQDDITMVVTWLQLKGL